MPDCNPKPVWPRFSKPEPRGLIYKGDSLRRKSSFFSATRLRRPLQVLTAVAIVLLLKYGVVSLAMVLIAGSAIGIVFGKVFCRWMCPMGFMMETMSGAMGDEKARAMYQYHKIGCPIAWVSGLLNRVSLLTVRHRTARECKSCGRCDKACYVASLNPEYSLYDTEKKNPADSYTCSRCLECVESCPTGRLALHIRKLTAERVAA
jgi:polyferredoxin